MAESCRGITDAEVIALARHPPKILVTEDKDFGEWVFAHGIRDISVILLRYPPTQTGRMSSILVHLLSNMEALIGKFAVVTVDKIRMRNLLE